MSDPMTETPAAREALAEIISAVPFEKRDGHGCAHRLYGPCSTCIAEALLPILAEREAAARSEALLEAAAVLPDLTHGAGGIGLARWGEESRDGYLIAIEEAQGALRNRAALVDPAREAGGR